MSFNGSDGLNPWFQWTSEVLLANDLAHTVVRRQLAYTAKLNSADTHGLPSFAVDEPWSTSNHVKMDLPLP